MLGERSIVHVSNGLTAKSDGKDKLLATVQYVLMFLSGGNPGTLKDMQVKVAGARKVFRIMKPLEVLSPFLREPYLPGRQPIHMELLPKLRSLFMASYFGFDHLVWLGSVNIIKDKKFLERCQKTSLWSWLLGSLSTITFETCSLSHGSDMSVSRQDDEDEEAYRERRAGLLAKMQKKMILLTHAVLQACLAIGLLQLVPIRPRATALFGVAASALNCYMMAPSLPPPPGPKPMLKLT